MSHILLIEDNVGNAEMIMHILRTAGYEVKHFIYGLEGAKNARQEPPSLILMDFNLPDIDGRTLALLLHKQLAHVPIVACTARAGDHEIRMAAGFGCSAFLSKPFAPEELLGLVKKLLEKSPPSPVSATSSTTSSTNGVAGTNGDSQKR
jgi:CheY-like chemotaxis protein